MHNLALFSLFDNTSLARTLAEQANAELLTVEQHTFPDTETLITVTGDVQDKSVAIVDSLYPANLKLMPLLIAADTLNELGASKVILIAPYLAYMRQDKRFHPGESVSAHTLGRVISAHFDALITVDPHLHRYHDLSEVFAIPSRALHPTHEMADWIKAQVKHPLLIGPDAESEQWVKAIADCFQLPFTVLQKIRHSDTEVSISPIEPERLQNKTPVLVDDMISTGHTLITVIQDLLTQTTVPPICLTTHALLCDDANTKLLKAGVARIVSTNSIEHPTQQIDLTPLIAPALLEMCKTL